MNILRLTCLLLLLFSKSLYAQEKKEHKPKIVGAPVIAYLPETSWQFGAGAKFLFNFKNDTIPTRTSFLAFTARYTLLHQIIFNPNYIIFTNGEKFLIKGEAGFTKFPNQYFGIGNNTPRSNKEEISFRQITFDNIFYKKVKKDLFVGLGYRFINTYDLQSEKNGLLQKEEPPGYNGSIVSGLTAAITYDSRDNILNSTEGELIEFIAGAHGNYLGGNYNFISFLLDARKYISPFPHRDDVVALQFYGMSSSSQTPFTSLAALGGDRIMRGYYQGRFRDQNIMVVQAEYRLPVYGRFGMTFFGGLGDVAGQVSDYAFSSIKPSYGAGLRFLVSKPDNLNIRFDYAFGRGGESMFYLNIAEAF
ncbi:BamA/TamA family outer membrane protein [Cytophagaceae bacterium ABcell3]|nr:BamA/TamA family outer membrane protein [Cytophagaceae bacterium ABcell3]